MQLSADAIDHVLATWPVARLATLAPDGRLHQVPLVFARVDSLLWSPVDAKPKADRELARVRNLRANPAASLLLDHYDESWRYLWWLRVDVVARVIEPADAGADPRVEAVVEALRRKYPQYGEGAVLRDPPVLVAFEPIATTSWCAGRDAMPVR